MNFIAIKEWMVMTLVTLGLHGRQLFNTHMLTAMEGEDIPQSMKVHWNEAIQTLLTGPEE